MSTTPAKPMPAEMQTAFEQVANHEILTRFPPEQKAIASSLVKFANEQPELLQGIQPKPEEVVAAFKKSNAFNLLDDDSKSFVDKVQADYAQKAQAKAEGKPAEAAKAPDETKPDDTKPKAGEEGLEINGQKLTPEQMLQLKKHLLQAPDQQPQNDPTPITLGGALGMALTKFFDKRDKNAGPSAQQFANGQLSDKTPTDIVNERMEKFVASGNAIAAYKGDPNSIEALELKAKHVENGIGLSKSVRDENRSMLASVAEGKLSAKEVDEHFSERSKKLESTQEQVAKSDLGVNDPEFVKKQQEQVKKIQEALKALLETLRAGFEKILGKSAKADDAPRTPRPGQAAMQ